MAYERNDRRFGGNSSDDRNRSDYGRGGGYGREQYGAGSRDPRGERFDDDRSGQRGSREGGRDYGRDPSGYDYQDRGFFNRAGDEVRSWFGDDDADRRRRADERHQERDQGRDYPEGGRFAPYGSGGSGQGGGFGGGSYGSGGGGYSPSDYGAGRGAGATGNWGLGAGRDRQDWGRDPSYQSWRDRQIQALDQDYDDYRREHQQKFDTEFHGWRQNRQGQRDQLRQVQEHMEVVGSDGQHVGKVDHVRGDQIKLAKNDQDAKGQHHYIPVSWIQSVDDKVTISKSADQAKQHWRDEQRNAGGGGSDFIGGSHQIDRNFSGAR